MSFHILGGTWKSRILKSPAGPLVKPTTSLIRKAVFDMCQTFIVDATFLDLFACSGAMGLEALSRGARHATFIEKDRKTMRILQENIASLQAQAQTLSLCADVFTRLPSLSSVFDIVYIDPPYPLSADLHSPILALLSYFDTASCLPPGAHLFLEESYPGNPLFLEQNLPHLHPLSHRRYGTSLLHHWEKR